MIILRSKKIIKITSWIVPQQGLNDVILLVVWLPNLNLPKFPNSRKTQSHPPPRCFGFAFHGSGSARRKKK